MVVLVSDFFTWEATLVVCLALYVLEFGPMGVKIVELGGKSRQPGIKEKIFGIVWFRVFSFSPQNFS